MVDSPLGGSLAISRPGSLKSDLDSAIRVSQKTLGFATRRRLNWIGRLCYLDRIVI